MSFGAYVVSLGPPSTANGASHTMSVIVVEGGTVTADDVQWVQNAINEKRDREQTDDAVYVRITDAPIVRTVCLATTDMDIMVNVVLDAEGKTVGVEIV